MFSVELSLNQLSSNPHSVLIQMIKLFCYRLVTGSGATKIMPPATITQEKLFSIGTVDVCVDFA